MASPSGKGFFRLTDSWAGIAAAMLICAGLSSAQTLASPVTLENTEQRPITATKIRQQYTLLVSLPDDYAKSGKRYPVLYVLDGWHFPLMTFLQDNARFSKRMPATVTVTVSHGSTNYMALRARDFTPTKTSREAGSGGAAAFLDFFEHELIPFVDRTYRTLPGDRALLGHSYAGLFAIYALEQRPGLFQRIVAASPSLWWDDRVLVKAARQTVPKIPGPVRLDISIGGDEDASDVTSFVKLVDQLKLPNLDYRFTVYKGENHDSVRLVSFPAGLYWVYGTNQ